jgi:hypothetical protein
MKKRVAVLVASAALVSIIGAAQAVSQRTGSIDGPIAAAIQSTPSASTILRMPGTIDKYEASTGVLSLETANGKVQFPLATATRIRRDGRRIDAADLAKLSGRRAAVRYSESDGHKTVESVHVFTRDEALGR